MKKIKYLFGFLFLVGLVSFSCSQDEIEASNDRQTILLRSKDSTDSLATFFKEVVIKSQQYAESSAARQNLVSKFKIPFDSSIKTKTDFLKWVELNLSQTGFINVLEAESLWDENFSKTADLVNKFESFYTEVRKSTESEILIIFEPIFQNPIINVQTSCETTCLNWVTGQYASARNKYNSSMASIGGWNFIGQYAVTLIEYDSAIEAANAGFGACIDGC